MLLQRKFEEMAGRIYTVGLPNEADATKPFRPISGFCHLYIGQEAIAAGIMTATHEEDNMITAYRDHGLAIAKGISARECMAELFGKATGCTKGKGGSMHFFSKEKRFFGGHGIVGGQIGLGAGIAFADKYNENNRVTICMFGDGAARQGILHEVFNMAMTWKLPVIFICENNQYAMGTSVKRTSNVQDIYKFADAYDMPADSTDGMNPEDVHNSIERAVRRARAGDGPTLIEMKCQRFVGHSMSDAQQYRENDEIKTIKELDPIPAVLKIIKDNNYATDEELELIHKKINLEIQDAVEFAKNSPDPTDEQLYKDIYSDDNYPFIVD